MSVTALVSDAERAIQGGDLKRAAKLLEEAANEGDDTSLWLKAAALHRASGNPNRALESVHSGLSRAPLDFTLLLMKASLMQRLSHPDAGQSWGHALAQKPTAELPPQLAAAVAEGERHHAEWLAAREARMKAAMGEAEKRAGPEELRRLQRFRQNVLGRSKPFHSNPTHFSFPELSEREFHPRSLFPWLAELEGMTDTIAAELQAVLVGERAELVPYIQYEDHLPLDQWKALNRNPDWTAIHLSKNGGQVAANARHCPKTLDFLAGLPQPQIPKSGPNAMFSLLAPHTAIPPHVGVSNARLVCHLPLIVPQGCWFRVGAETRFWKRGEAFVFDDTIEHEAMNPSDELRIVFIFDIWHPDLSPVERDAVAALIGSDASAGAL